MARDSKVVIRLTDDVKAEFEQVAAEHGMTLSALGSYVIGSYLRQQRQLIQPIKDAMVDTLNKQMEKAFQFGQMQLPFHAEAEREET